MAERNVNKTPPKKKVKLDYKQSFKSEWLGDPQYNNWLKPVLKNKNHAFCNVCQQTLKECKKISFSESSKYS